EFEIDYLRYYKHNPQVVSCSFNTSGASFKAIQGINDEDYTWTVVSGPAVLNTVTNMSQSSRASFYLQGGPCTLRVQSKTGSSLVDPLYNPLLTSKTDFRVNGTSCWAFCATDVISGI